MAKRHPAGARCSLISILDAFPFPVMLMDADLRLQGQNRAATEMLGGNADPALPRLCGDALQCFMVSAGAHRCGETPACRKCAIRSAVLSALDGAAVYRQVHAMEVGEGDQRKQVWLRVSASPFQPAETPLALVTLEDVTEVVQLRRLIPMCASCRKVRHQDSSYWQDVESYLARHTAITFTHGICPECVRRLYPEVADGAGEAGPAGG